MAHVLATFAEVSKNTEQLRGEAHDIHALVAEVAEDIAKFSRRGGSNPKAELPRDDGNASSSIQPNPSGVRNDDELRAKRPLSNNGD